MSKKIVIEGVLVSEDYECLYIDDKPLPDIVEMEFDQIENNSSVNCFGRVRVTIERLEDV